ncbi:MAG: hypothetical protein M1335_03865, partial [Chloroflexi bacterium]|nr:hypothetical protein [Chloroflexota bacterium]
MRKSFPYPIIMLAVIGLVLSVVAKNDTDTSSVRRLESLGGRRKPRAMSDGEKPVKIALIASKASGDYGVSKLGRGVDFSYYSEEILQNYWLSFDIIPDEQISNKKLAPYTLVIASGWSRSPSRTAASAVRGYVEGGGVFLASGWLLADGTDGRGRLDQFLGVAASQTGKEQFRLSFGQEADPIIREDGAGEVYGARRTQGSQGFDRILVANSGAKIGGMFNSAGVRVGDALVVAKHGGGYAVATGLDCANTIAAYREPTKKVVEYQGDHNSVAVKEAAESYFKNLIEYSLSLKGVPMVFKWNSERGARTTVFDRDDIDRPFDFGQIEKRVQLREKHKAHGTTYVRVTPGSGLPALITKAQVADWEKRGTEMALHSEIVSKGGGSPSA